MRSMSSPEFISECPSQSRDQEGPGTSQPRHDGANRCASDLSYFAIAAPVDIAQNENLLEGWPQIGNRSFEGCSVCLGDQCLLGCRGLVRDRLGFNIFGGDERFRPISCEPGKGCVSDDRKQ